MASIVGRVRAGRMGRLRDGRIILYEICIANISNQKTMIFIFNRFTTALTQILLLAMISIFQTGCCSHIDCAVDESEVAFNFSRNGNDAVFGDNPILDFDDVRITSEFGSRPFMPQSNGQISAVLSGSVTYLIEARDIDTIVVQASMAERINNNGCCGEYRFNLFIIEGDTICNSSCTEINIEI